MDPIEPSSDRSTPPIVSIGAPTAITTRSVASSAPSLNLMAVTRPSSPPTSSWPEVDREYVVVASQLYLGSKAGGADVDALGRGVEDAAMFNGYPDQYVHAPLTATVGERVRWWVVVAGPGGGTAFHIVGAQFDTVLQAKGQAVDKRATPAAPCAKPHSPTKL